jgi:hypothetical protein
MAGGRTCYANSAAPATASMVGGRHGANSAAPAHHQLRPEPPQLIERQQLLTLVVALVAGGASGGPGHCWWPTGGASGPIVGAPTGGAGRPGTKRLTVGSDEQPCAKRGPPSKAPRVCRACTFANHKPFAPVCGMCLNRRS